MTTVIKSDLNLDSGAKKPKVCLRQLLRPPEKPEYGIYITESYLLSIKCPQFDNCTVTLSENTSVLGRRNTLKGFG